MSNELKYPQWQEPFRNAVAAFGTQQLSERLKKVEAMVLNRLQLLSSDIKGLDERQALLDAISIIRVLNRDKMQFKDMKAGPADSCVYNGRHSFFAQKQK